MDDLLRLFLPLRSLPARDAIIALIDVLLVAFLIYRLLLIVRGTRAWRILLGVLFFVLVLWLSGMAGFRTLHWLLDKATILGPVALVILFLPELRQAIEGVGKLGAQPLRSIASAPAADEPMDERTIDEVVTALFALGSERVGALVVVETTHELGDVAMTGVPMGHARISAPFLRSVFYGQNPLHDGAALVRGDDVVAAACRLPLSENPTLDPAVHMRHRAAVGVTEATDCIALVVSEERGAVSLAREGVLTRMEHPRQLREALNRYLRGVEPAPPAEAPKSPRTRRRFRRGEETA